MAELRAVAPRRPPDAGTRCPALRRGHPFAAATHLHLPIFSVRTERPVPASALAPRNRERQRKCSNDRRALGVPGVELLPFLSWTTRGRGQGLERPRTHLAGLWKEPRGDRKPSQGGPGTSRVPKLRFGSTGSSYFPKKITTRVRVTFSQTLTKLLPGLFGR